MAKSCLHCGASLGDESSAIRMYCSESCKKKVYYRRKKAKAAVAKLPEVAAGVERMRALDDMALAGGDPIYSEFRALLSDALRTNISQYVQDQLLGSGEILAGMVPKALAILGDEMDSDNDYVRSRAVAATMKYAMAFKGQEATNDSLGTINVVHNMGTTVPDTRLGHATVAASEELAERQAERQAQIEAGEIVLEACGRCKEMKHPSTLRMSRASEGGVRLCSSCWLQYEYSKGTQLDPAAFASHDPEYGIG